MTLPKAWLIRSRSRAISGRSLGASSESSTRRASAWVWPPLHLFLKQLMDRTHFEVQPQLAVVGLRQPVEVGDQTTQPVHLLDDVVGGFFGRLENRPAARPPPAG